MVYLNKLYSKLSLGKSLWTRRLGNFQVIPSDNAPWAWVRSPISARRVLKIIKVKMKCLRFTRPRNILTLKYNNTRIKFSFMAKNKAGKNRITEEILAILMDLGNLIPEPFETPHAWIRRAGGSVPKTVYSRTVYRLKKQGLLEITKKNNEKFLRLTNKGQIKALLTMAKIPKTGRWDGKWRLVMFDIPENSKNQRDLLRLILKKQGFKKFQASVFIGPQPINRSAIKYLQISGLINYTRMLRVDEVDEEKELLRLFRLKR